MRPISAGMWAVDEKGRVGVVFLVEAGAAEFHLVNDIGETTLAVKRSVDGLVQARHREIPEGRRPSKKLAAKMGYAV